VTTELSFQEDQHVHIILILAAAAASPQPSPPSEGEIIVTAAREPLGVADAPVSATLFGETTIQALSLPASTDLLRLSPGVSVATSGPRGSQAQVRIRGAEANHTLLFVDGIRFNDPAAGNEPRFELLMNDPLSRVELVRGPQSALWGSEALGGVVAAETATRSRYPASARLANMEAWIRSAPPRRPRESSAIWGLSGFGELDPERRHRQLRAGGEQDGFENKSAHVKTVLRPTSIGEIGIVGHYVDGTSEYDGFDPATFRRADTLDTTDNRIAALGGWARTEAAGFSFDLNGSYLHSRNRNRLAGDPLNSTFGERFTLGGQLSRTFGGHRVTAAVEHEGEAFRARDQVFFGGTDQDRSRELTALVGEWHARWSDALVTDVAVRHDSFSAFQDATTFRASALVRHSADGRCTPPMARESRSRPSTICSVSFPALSSAIRA
jgi:vitamin B12 transporter